MLARAFTLAAAVSLAGPAVAQVGPAPSTEPPSTYPEADVLQEANVVPRNVVPSAVVPEEASVDPPPDRRPPGYEVETPATAVDGTPDGAAASPVNADGAPPAPLAADTLVQWIRQDSDAEIALAQFAVQKAQNPAVRAFAEAMIVAHTRLNQQLDELATAASALPETPLPETADRGVGARGAGDQGEAAASAAPAPRAGDVRALAMAEPEGGVGVSLSDAIADAALADRLPATEPPLGSVRTAARPVFEDAGAAETGAAAATADLLAFRGQLARRSGRTLRNSFDRLAPAEFDRAYLSQQIGAHLSMFDTLGLAADHTTDGPTADLFLAGRAASQQRLLRAVALWNALSPAASVAENAAAENPAPESPIAPNPADDGAE